MQEVADRSCEKHGSEKLRSESPHPSIAARNNQQGAFAKRKRHKTRESRYEPNQKSRALEEKSVDRPRRKKARQVDASRAARQAGEELMRNFSSKNVSNERVTLRPPVGFGIFNNGRASSSNPRRELPDLAFSEMEFLRNSRHSYMLDDEPIQSVMHEKANQAQDYLPAEKSNFFANSKRSPLKERAGQDAATDKPRSTVDERVSLYSRSNSRDDSTKHSRTRLQPFNASDKSVQGLRMSRSSPKLPFPRPPISTEGNSENIPPESRLSELASTVLTWSESQRRPLQTRLKPMRHSRSSTPESIRIHIENTGIFEDTEIARYQSHQKVDTISSKHSTQSDNKTSNHHSHTPRHASTDLPQTRNFMKTEVMLGIHTTIPIRNLASITHT
ncbi:hypothetical protein PVAG01_05652 [Phlyctema vagabunda]|uniref:Uncharacterized protein n=1 Tax=Phlyctema vagabunda TaxID=108571 RepID=A0ABR4PKS4_9HELO